MTGILRFGAALCGLALVAVAADRAVAAHGGYGSPDAPQIIALAVGLAVGGFFATRAAIERRWLLAVVLGVGALACEVPMIAMTLQRVAKDAVEAQAPAREHARKLADARTRVVAAEGAVQAAVSSARLQSAILAKKAADAAVIAQAADRGCRENCRALLEQQVAAASREVDAARLELDTRRVAAERELRAAHAAVESIGSPPASSSAAADLLGVPAWFEALTRAIATAVGLNVMGAALIAYATHARKRRPETLWQPPISGAHHLSVIEARPLGDVGEWMAEAMARRRGRGGVSAQEAYGAYLAWCSLRSFDPVPPTAFAETLFDRAREGSLILVPKGDDVVIAGHRLLTAAA